MFWPFTFYFSLYAAVAFWAPFLVLYYQSLGFSGPQIGLLTGLSPLLVLVCTPLWASLADVTRRHRLILTLTLIGSGLAIGLYPFFRAFLPVLALSAVFNLFFAPVTALADTAAMRLLAGAREMYGRLRLGGTLGFTLTVVVVGLVVQRYGLRAAFFGGAGLYLVALVLSQKIWPPAAPQSAPHPVALSGARRALLTNPRWLLFLLGAFAGGLAFAASNNYLFSYLKELGAPESLMGFALTLGNVSEVPVLFFGHRLLRWLRPYPLFLISLLIAAARMLLMGVAGTVAQGVLIQTLIGLTFPTMWMAGVAYADENAPVGLSATAQGLFGAAVFGVGSAAGGFLGGPLLAGVGAHTLFLIFGFIVLVILLGVVLLGALLPRVVPPPPQSPTLAAPRPE